MILSNSYENISMHQFPFQRIFFAIFCRSASSNWINSYNKWKEVENKYEDVEKDFFSF